MKILEITAFSSGICGLWARVSAESEILANKKHEVNVFSSNIKRGSGKIEYAPEFEEKNKVKITRFKTNGSFGQNTFFWNYEKKALKLRPDIIIVHAYRQYYSTKALKVAKRLKIPCILVTHAPFLDKNLRNWKLNLVVFFYDNLIGRRILNKYSKIFAITKWEIPYLKNLGMKKEKIIYVPNGIPEEFLKTKIPKTTNNKQQQILFLGRIAPIKDIETLLKGFKLALEKNSKISLKFVGPIEENYGVKINNLIKDLKLENIIFSKPIYNLKKKIKLIDNSDIFILPSKREGMPQSLIEAMAREKIVISSKNDGGKELVQDNKNGYLFNIGNEKQLAKKICEALKDNKKNNQIRKNAKKSVKKFSWKKLGNKIEEILKEQISKNK